MGAPTTGGTSTLRTNAGVAFDAAWIQHIGETPDPSNGTSMWADGRATGLVRDEANQEPLVAIVRALDLTALSATDSEPSIRALCARAIEPLPAHIVAPDGQPVRVAAVCVFPFFLPLVRVELNATRVRVASVAAGFPDGLSPLSTRVAEVAWCRENGADEIDVVIARPLALQGDWNALYDTVRAFRNAAGDATLKVILSVSELGDESGVARAAATCLMAGAAYLKTSTGRERAPATLSAGATMLREILRYRSRTGHAAGFKAAGSIRTMDQAREWYDLYTDILVTDARSLHGFRIGASGLLEEIRRAFT